MVTNFKKSFLLLITAIFFTQSLILGCSTEVDSEVKKMEEEKPDVITVVKKTHSVQGIPDSWETTDVYAYVYDANGNKVLIPVTVKDGVATFEADETYTKCVLVSLPKGTDVSAFTDNPASILDKDYQKSEVIDLTKDSLSFVLVKSDYIGTWNSLTDELVINEDGTFSLDIGTDGSADCAGIYVDTKTGVKASYSEKVDGTDVSKNIEFTKKEVDVLLGSVNEKETYFVKDSNETPNLNGTWTSSNGKTVIINNESKTIYVNDGETEIWGTIVQTNNMLTLQDESSNVIGIGFVSAAGNAYIYNEATGTYEIFTRNGSATESDSKIPLKMFTVTYKSEFAKDDVQEKPEGTVLELPTPSHKGYRFDGWYTNAEKTAKAEATYTIAENLTFYAKWVQQVTVKFTSAQSEHADKVVDIGTEITIEDPTKEKFAFDGWFDGETKVSGKYTVTKDVELVAKWTALYNVTFETSGGSPVDSLENVRAGTEITLPETILADSEFEYWSDGEKTYNIDGKYTVNSDVIFVAKWVGLCTVVYNTDGGSSVESETVHDMETIHMPAAPTKDGYRFLGWYTTDENNLMQPDDVFNVTDSVIINAKWIAVYTYEYNDGIPADEDPNYQAPTADDGYVLTLKAAPVRDGYVFKGWSDGEQIYQPGASYTITANVVFEAVWVELFTYEYIDGIPADEDPNYQAPTAEDGEVLTLKSAPVREGYVFKGWKVGEQLYDAGATYTITADVVFVAVWNELYYYYYDRNDGVPTDLDISSLPKKENGREITVGDAIERPGYEFAGWRVDEQTYQQGDSYTITKNTVFTAVWKVLVTYSSEYTEHEEERVEEGKTIELPSPTYDGYTFNHWTSNISEAWYSAGDEVEISEKVTFTAVWTKNPVAYSISGVPTNETWTSGTVVAWVWNDNVETGFVVKPTFDKGTADYSFETAEDIKYCTIFVVDSMPSESVTKDALTENATAKSADMYFSSGKAVFEAVYTIINVSDWYDDASAEIYISYEKDDEMQWINVTDNVEVAENGTLTIEFQSSDVITECTLSRFDPDDVDGLSDLSSVKPWNSVDLIFGDSCFTEFHDKFAIDSSKVYFKNAASFGIGIYVYFYNEGDSLPSTSNLSALTQMTAEPNGDGWYGAPADFTKEKVAFYGKDGNQNNSGWTIECDLIEGEIFFKAAGEKNTSGSNSGKYNMESFSSIKDALSKEVSKSTN